MWISQTCACACVWGGEGGDNFIMYSIPVVTGSPSLDGPAPTLVEALMKQVYRDPDVNPRTSAVVIGPS